MVTAAARIENLRVAWERDLEAEAELCAPRGYGIDRGRLDKRVRLERTMAERVHRIADEVAARLGCTDPFVIYQSARDRHISAQALLDETPFAIRLIGPIASVLDDAALASLIGHEFGHWLAHGPRATPRSSLLRAWEKGAPKELCLLSIAAAELTADRVALVAARGELEAAVRLDVAIETLDSPRALGVNELEHLAELCRRVEAHEERALRGDGYPMSAFRLFATHLFWRSEVHRELTGQGPGDLVLRDVDARLRLLAEASVRPVDVPSPRRPTRKACAPRAWSSLEADAHKVAASVATRIGRFVQEVVGRPAADTPTGHDDAAADDASPDLELDDLEARFLELEERERKKPA
jgi:hypothetical protein